ncbi:MAG TPA: DNA-directed RNA polymerase subunit omega [Vicinamibacterales bacterium]
MKVVTDRAEIKNAFEFVTLAGARARQLLAGCTPKTEGSTKPARLAQKEVREGWVQKVEGAE